MSFAPRSLVELFFFTRLFSRGIPFFFFFFLSFLHDIHPFQPTIDTFIDHTYLYYHVNINTSRERQYHCIDPILTRIRIRIVIHSATFFYGTIATASTNAISTFVCTCTCTCTCTTESLFSHRREDRRQIVSTYTWTSQSRQRFFK